MSLSIDITAAKVRRFLTYDLEWVPGTLRVRLVGVYDGQKYRSYRTVDEFLDNELTSKTRGCWYFAHAGGLADVQFLLEKFAERAAEGADIEVKASFSGSSAIIVHLRIGRNCWHFIDSYWLLRDKLSKTGGFVGKRKLTPLHPDGTEYKDAELREWYETVPLPELVTYNERDCVILWEGISMFEAILLELGGQLQMTLAGCALKLFRRTFLTQEIESNDLINAAAREAYSASRVEVYNPKCGDAFYYDVNSSFPHAMTFDAPGNLLRESTRIPTGPNALYLAQADITVPDSYYAPLPYRIKGRVFYPAGRWQSWFCNTDLEVLENEGGTINRIHRVMEFEPFSDLSSYAQTLYERRRSSSDEMLRNVLKILLNGLYGKFGERQEKLSIHINPPAAVLETMTEDNETAIPGVWQIETIADVPHMHVPISVHITAIARRTLLDYMKLCRDGFYCDTDGFATTEKLDVSDKLGKLKLEKIIKRGTFVAPKIYRIEGLDEKGESIDLVKAKGFSRMDVDKFMRLMEGTYIEIERMARVREQCNKGTFTPEEKTIRKALRMGVLPKRMPYPDGETRPWQVRELQSGGILPPEMRVKL